jgi:hypothetical protein
MSWRFDAIIIDGVSGPGPDPRIVNAIDPKTSRSTAPKSGDGRVAGTLE